MGVIFFLSNPPGLKITEGPLDFWMRKMAHVGEYAILFLLFYRALRGSFRLEEVSLYLIAGILSFLYAISDEFHQLFVPTRVGNLFDLGFDLFGILAGVILIFFLRMRIR